jgi:regulatory protein
MRPARRPPLEDPDDAEAAEAAAVRILSGATQSVRALRTRLRQGGFSTAASLAAIERCRQLGYLDDAALAASLSARLERSGHGRARVAAEMRARGLGADAVATELERLAPGEQLRALEAGRRLLAKELRRGDEGDGMRRRIAAALQRRGFTAGVIATTLRTLSLESRQAS